MSVYLSVCLYVCISVCLSVCLFYNFPIPAVLQSLGQVGRVMSIFETGDCEVWVNGQIWSFNPKALVPAPGETPPDVPGMTSLFGMMLWNLSLVYS